MTVLEKLLAPALSSRFSDQGFDLLSGPVHRADDHVGRTPAQRVAAHGLTGDRFGFGPSPTHVDVVRFSSRPGMQLDIWTAPPTPGERPMPLYEHGFLLDGSPVWRLSATRVPTGARYIRVDPDGSEREFSRYDGAAWGWRNARGYTPPVQLIGPRARWRGLDLPGSFTPDQSAFALVHVGAEDVPRRFTPTRPRVHVREVPVAKCEEISEVVVRGCWRGVDVRLLETVGRQTRLLLLDPTRDTVAATGAVALDPWTFLTTAPATEVRDVGGVSLHAFVSGRPPRTRGAGGPASPG